MTNPITPNPSIFTGIKSVIMSICSSIVKSCNQIDSSLDISQDLIDTCKVHSSSLLSETQLTCDSQLLLLEQSLPTPETASTSS